MWGLRGRLDVSSLGLTRFDVGLMCLIVLNRALIEQIGLTEEQFQQWVNLELAEHSVSIDCRRYVISPSQSFQSYSYAVQMQSLIDCRSCRLYRREVSALSARRL